MRDVRERLRQHQQTMSEYKNVAFFVAYTICFLLVIAQQVGILGDCLTFPAPYASRHAAPCMLALFDVWRMHSVGLGPQQTAISSLPCASRSSATVNQQAISLQR